MFIAFLRRITRFIGEFLEKCSRHWLASLALKKTPYSTYALNYVGAAAMSRPRNEEPLSLALQTDVLIASNSHLISSVSGLGHRVTKGDAHCSPQKSVQGRILQH